MNRDRGMGQRPDAFVVLILVLVTCALAFVFGGRASAAPIVDVDVPLEARHFISQSGDRQCGIFICSGEEAERWERREQQRLRRERDDAIEQEQWGRRNPPRVRCRTQWDRVQRQWETVCE